MRYGNTRRGVLEIVQGSCHRFQEPLCMDSLTKVSTLSTKYSHAVCCLLVHKDVLFDETTLTVCDTPARTIVLHCYT